MLVLQLPKLRQKLATPQADGELVQTLDEGLGDGRVVQEGARDRLLHGEERRLEPRRLEVAVETDGLELLIDGVEVQPKVVPATGVRFAEDTSRELVAMEST